MNAPRFDHIARQFGRGTTRRRLLTGLALSPLAGLVAARPAVGVAAKKKRKKNKKAKQPQPNAYGCLDVGDACKNEEQCCSGICTGKKGKKTCRAHDTGGCAAGTQSEGCGGTRVACRTNAGALGHCATTTGNAGYCLMYSFCIACQTDADCQAADGGVLGPTAACIPCAGCPETGGTMCATADFLAGMTQVERNRGQ